MSRLTYEELRQLIKPTLDDFDAKFPGLRDSIMKSIAEEMEIVSFVDDNIINFGSYFVIKNYKLRECKKCKLIYSQTKQYEDYIRICDKCGEDTTEL